MKGQSTNRVEGQDTDLRRVIEDNTADIIFRADRDAHIISANPAFERAFGYFEAQVRKRNFRTFLTPDSSERFNEYISLLNKTPDSTEEGMPQNRITVEGVNSAGHTVSMQLLVTRYQEKGENRLLGIAKDMSHQERALNELEALKGSYWALSETSTDAILQITEDFKIIYANSAVKSVFDYDDEELIESDFRILFPPSVYKRYLKSFKKYFIIDEHHREASKLTNTIEVLGQKRSKDIIPLEISFGNSKDIVGQRILTCIVRDITQRKKTERKLRYLAYHDKLTDLGNRDLFYLTLDQFLSNAKRYSDTIGALLFLDLDGFKKVNDTLGHNVGDKILCECARRLSSCLRESDHVYRFSEEGEEEHSLGPGAHEDLFRFGGDEFVILLTHLNHATDAAVVAQKIINSVRKPFVVKEFASLNRINLGVSIGISLIPQNGAEPTNLIRSADIAMYKAKEVKNCYTFFTAEINRKATDRLMLEAGLRSALERGEFDLHFQPLVDVKGHIKGVEALLRWKREKEQYISPAEFIPIAEETGLIIPIGDLVLEKACRQLYRWNAKGFKDLYVSVNLSVKQFNHGHIVEKIKSTVKRTRVDPKNLKIEITESCIVKNPSEARIRMKKIKEMGIRIAIDDFGAGYSSLSYISELPVDILKIDQSFVINLHKEQNTKVINTIIALAHSLNLDVVAEGVETQDQLTYLISKKCHTFQGFLFGKAVPADEISELLDQRRVLQPSTTAAL